MPVYDDEKLDKKDLGNANGIGPDEDKPDEGDEAGKDAADTTSQKGLSGDDLKSAEETGGAPAATKADKKEASLGNSNDQLGSGYREEGKGGGKNGKNKARFSRRKKIIGGGAAGLIITTVISFLALLPLKINHIVENLQSRFFASSESAVHRRTERLFSDYVKKHVLPSLGSNCRSTHADKSCVAAVPGEGRLAKLYNGWRDSNLEGKLASNYGIEFEKRGNTPYMKVSGEGIDVSDLTNGKATELRDIQAVGRKDVRAKWMNALEGETKFKKVMYRFKVGRLLERKYGIKRCLFACNLKDNFADWKDGKKKAAKVMFAERILTPRSAYLGLLFECLLEPPGPLGCERNVANGKDGEKRDEYQRRLDAKIKEYGSSFGGKAAGEKAIEKLILDAEKISAEGGFRKYVIQKIFKEGVAEAINNGADKFVPVIGWINTAANLYSKASHLGSQYKRWVYITNATAMVGTFMMYRSHADELKSGNVDISLLGSMAGTFSKDASDNNKGQPAEVSPLYSNVLGSSSTNAQTGFLDLLSPAANAQGTDSSGITTYKCDNGNPPEKGKLICPEESLTTDNAITDFSNLLNSGPLSGVSTLADFWESSAGVVLGYLSKLAGGALEFVLHGIPGYNQAADFAGKLIDPLLKAVADILIPDPFSDMSGARAFNMAVGGADVAGNFFSHFGLGGHLLTAAQIGAIQSDQADQAQLEFAQKPLYARLFDQEDTHSLVSQVAMSMPTNMSFFGRSLASLTNPFSGVLSRFGSTLTGSRVHAATATPDPFGISQYGYALDDPAMTADPAIYTDDYCKNADSQWADTYQQENPNTGVFEHTVTNPCRLDSDAISSAGALFTDSVLSPSDTTFDPGE